MALTTDFKRSQLRLIYERRAPASAKTFRDYLLDRLEALEQYVSGTPSIRSTSGGGHSVEFSDGFSAGMSPREASGLCSELLDLYDTSKAALVASGNAAPSEDEIYSEMLSRLVGAFVVLSDFSNVREGVEA